MTGFTELADGVHLLRHPVLDVNVTLVVGGSAALVVDSLSTPAQARALRDEIGRITRLPLIAVNTHHHFDHCFGNAALDPVAIHAHPEAVALLAALDPEEEYAGWSDAYPELGRVTDLTVRLPDVPVPHERSVDLGGRTVVLRHLGRGHTAGDLVAHLPDAALVVAGDLVEESGPPLFDDGYPLEWPETLTALLGLGATTVVPGHGAVCDRAFVRAQHDQLTELAWLIREGHRDCAPADAVVNKAPYPFEVAAVAVARGYAELDGTV